MFSANQVFTVESLWKFYWTRIVIAWNEFLIYLRTSVAMVEIKRIK